jgi:hypothetical protein
VEELKTKKTRRRMQAADGQRVFMSAFQEVRNPNFYILFSN